MMATYPDIAWKELEKARALAQRVEELSKNLSEEAEKLSKSLNAAKGGENDAGRDH